MPEVRSLVILFFCGVYRRKRLPAAEAYAIASGAAFLFPEFKDVTQLAGVAMFSPSHDKVVGTQFSPGTDVGGPRSMLSVRRMGRHAVMVSVPEGNDILQMTGALKKWTIMPLATMPNDDNGAEILSRGIDR